MMMVKVRNPSPKKMKVVKVLLLIVIAILCACLLVLLISSPGKLSPLKDESGNIIDGSISEKTWIEVGGIRQGMFIRGESPANPVILYLHGGPGTPMLQFISYLEKMKNPERLEEYFTVCYWDQRGAGMTYSKSTDASTMTVEQMVEDTREVTEYLKSRFGQEKIYLLGHSWGSYLGVKTIEKYPENYLAYIGVGQVTNQTESERLAYQYMAGHAKVINDNEVIEKLERFDPNAEGFPWMQKEGPQLDYLMARTDIFNKYGIGHLHQGLPQGMTFNGMVFRALFGFKGYTLREKINWFLGADFSMVRLFPVILNDDLFVSSVKFDVPFYIVQGHYDYQVSQVLAEKYFDAVVAPQKGFFLFDDSAHSPNLEEPERFIEIFRKIALDNPLEE
jgi:pimeloyl-ACP methyl ester carboxylesterase